MSLPENIQRWLQELRFGEHKQTAGTLKRNLGGGSVGYCCLGVYVEKVKNKTVKAVAKSDGVHEGAMKWYHLCEDDLGDDLKEKAAIMNDDGKTFVEIADFIENYYKENSDA